MKGCAVAVDSIRRFMRVIGIIETSDYDYFQDSAGRIDPAAEANRRFSELLRGVREQGKRYIVTSHGRPVAKVLPIDDADEDQAREAARKEAHERLMKRLRSQPGLNLVRFNRDDAYDD